MLTPGSHHDKTWTPFCDLGLPCSLHVLPSFCSPTAPHVFPLKASAGRRSLSSLPMLLRRFCKMPSLARSSAEWSLSQHSSLWSEVVMIEAVGSHMPASSLQWTLKSLRARVTAAFLYSGVRHRPGLRAGAQEVWFCLPEWMRVRADVESKWVMNGTGPVQDPPEK